MKNEPITYNHLRYILRIDAKRLHFKEKIPFFISKKSETQKLECMRMTSNDVKKYAKKILPTDKFDFEQHEDSQYDYYFEEFYPNVSFAKQAKDI